MILINLANLVLVKFYGIICCYIELYVFCQNPI